MGKLIARRLGLSIFILVAVSVIIFCVTLYLPGAPARAILGQQATPERIAALQAEMSLHKNPVERYFLWLRGMLTGDFGTSTTTGGPVSELLREPLVNSLVLMALAALIAIPLAPRAWMAGAGNLHARHHAGGGYAIRACRSTLTSPAEVPARQAVKSQIRIATAAMARAIAPLRA